MTLSALPASSQDRCENKNGVGEKHICRPEVLGRNGECDGQRLTRQLRILRPMLLIPSSQQEKVFRRNLRKFILF